MHKFKWLLPGVCLASLCSCVWRTSPLSSTASREECDGSSEVRRDYELSREECLLAFAHEMSSITNMASTVVVKADQGGEFFVVVSKPPDCSRFRFILDSRVAKDVPAHTAVTVNASSNVAIRGRTNTYTSNEQLSRLERVLEAYGLEGNVVTYSGGTPAGSVSAVVRSYDGALTLAENELGAFTRDVFEKVYGLRCPYRVAIVTDLLTFP